MDTTPLAVRVAFAGADGRPGPATNAPWARIEGARLLIGSGRERAVLADLAPDGTWRIAAGSRHAGERWATVAISAEAVR